MAVEHFISRVKNAIATVASLPLGAIYLIPYQYGTIDDVTTTDAGDENKYAQKLQNGAVIPMGTTARVSGKNIMGSNTVFTVIDNKDNKNKSASSGGEIHYRGEIIYFYPESDNEDDVIKEIPLFGKGQWFRYPEE